MNQKIILVGGFHEVIELCEYEGIEIFGIFDNQKVGDYLGYKILGTDEYASDLYYSFKDIPVSITPDKPGKREILSKLYSKIGFRFSSIISSNCRISKSAEIGNGVFIQSGVNISSFSKIGNFVRINNMVNIMHDSVIGEFCTIAPNAVILGNVKIGNNSYIGANATILPHITVGQNVIIGSGSVITKNIPDDKVVAGNPGIEIKLTTKYS